MVECEGGCKTWVHLKCHKIKLGDDWFCDSCQQAVQTSKAHSDDLDDPMDEPADAATATPCNAPSSDALATSVGADKGRAGLSSPVDGGLAKLTSSSPDTNVKGLRAASSSPDGSGTAEDIELNLSPSVSLEANNSSKKPKKVSITGLHAVTPPA